MSPRGWEIAGQGVPEEMSPWSLCWILSLPRRSCEASEARGEPETSLPSSPQCPRGSALPTPGPFALATGLRCCLCHSSAPTGVCWTPLCPACLREPGSGRWQVPVGLQILCSQVLFCQSVSFIFVLFSK